MKKQKQEMNIWKVISGILFIMLLGMIAYFCLNDTLEKKQDETIKLELEKFSEVAKPGQQLTICRPDKNLCYSLRVPVGD